MVCFSLLTRIPIRTNLINKEIFGKSCWAFPLCGFFICSFSFLIFFFSLKIGFNEYIASIFFIICNIFLSGAIHEDGLADFSDGVFAGKDIKSKLIIMSDSRIGSFGVLGLILAFALKLISISQFKSDLNSYMHLLLIFMLSRYNMILFLRFLYPIKNNGLGKNYSIKDNWTLLLGLFPILPVLFFLKFNGIIIFFSMVLISLMFLGFIWVIFRGQTGDICGANQQISEVSGLLVLTLLI